MNRLWLRTIGHSYDLETFWVWLVQKKLRGKNRIQFFDDYEFSQKIAFAIHIYKKYREVNEAINSLPDSIYNCFSMSIKFNQ